MTPYTYPLNEGRAAIVAYHCDGTPLRVGIPTSVANPDQKAWHENSYLFTLVSGAFDFHRILVWADCMVDAIEPLGEWILEHVPTHISPLGDPCPHCDSKDPQECGCVIYTESGFIENLYQGQVIENPSKAHLIGLHGAVRMVDRGSKGRAI